MFTIIPNVLRLARADLRLLWRSRMLRLAVLAVSLVPAVYALIYLSSVWDPNAKTGALPAALVNLDAGVRYQGQEANVGRELSDAIVGKALYAGEFTLAEALVAVEARHNNLGGLDGR